MKGLKGKVVVIDFWATWCGPCVAEMPKMKELYAKYRDQGVEFIGVSLDQPKERGRARQPQEVCRGKRNRLAPVLSGQGLGERILRVVGHQRDPCDVRRRHEGNLYSVEARGKLEQMIPALLKKKNSPAGTVGGGE